MIFGMALSPGFGRSKFLWEITWYRRPHLAPPKIASPQCFLGDVLPQAAFFDSNFPMAF